MAPNKIVHHGSMLSLHGQNELVVAGSGVTRGLPPLECKIGVSSTFLHEKTSVSESRGVIFTSCPFGELGVAKEAFSANILMSIIHAADHNK